MWMLSPAGSGSGGREIGSFLCARADEVHLDAPVARVVDRLVPEGGEVEGAAELAVDAGEQIEVEGGRDAGGIVVGADQGARVLLEVDADDQPAARRQGGAEDARAGAAPRPA